MLYVICVLIGQYLFGCLIFSDLVLFYLCWLAWCLVATDARLLLVCFNCLVLCFVLILAYLFRISVARVWLDDYLLVMTVFV